jgi:hypothetical protein
VRTEEREGRGEEEEKNKAREDASWLAGRCPGSSCSLRALLAGWLGQQHQAGVLDSSLVELLVRHSVRVSGDLGQPQPREQRLQQGNEQRTRLVVSGFGLIIFFFLHTTIMPA